MKEHVINSCELFFSMVGLPTVYHGADDTIEAAYPLWLADMKPNMSDLSFQRSRNPGTFVSPSQGNYGRIDLKDGGRVVVGPAYSVPVNDEIVRCYMRENQIPIERWDQAKATLLQTQEMNYQKFTRHLTFLHYCINREKVYIAEHYDFRDMDKTRSLIAQQIRQTTAAKESGIRHNTYEYEQEYFARIREGDADKLLNFMLQYNSSNFYAGHLADLPLRNAQNRFIIAVSKVLVLSAIPGKLDLETAYQMVDGYIRECERSTTIAEVERLEYIMTMDFCHRIGASRAPKGISQEIYGCMNYIREHTNEHITVSHVAKHLGRSLSYLNVHFKEETGSTVSAYIVLCKLEEAARLLEFSDRSLAEISSYLCFSSQSYFQNLFKKEYGVTPMQYRKIHHG